MIQPDLSSLDLETVLIEDQDLRVLKGLMQDSTLGNDFFQDYDSSLFIGDAKFFAQLVGNYYKTYRASPTKRVLLDAIGNSPMAGKCHYILSALDQISFSSEEFQYDLAKLKRKSKQTRLLTLKEAINSSQEYDELVKKMKEEIDLSERIFERKKKPFTQKTLKNYKNTFVQDYLTRKNNPELTAGIPVKYSFIDYVTGGAQGGDFWIIFGETSSGKSVWLNNIGVNLWQQDNDILTTSKFSKGNDVLYFSLEMPYKMCFRRTIARLANVPLYGLRDATLLQHQWEAVERALEFIDSYPYEFEIVDIPRGATISDLERAYKNSRIKPKAVFVDYLGLMERDVSGEEDWLKLTKISGDLQEFARTYDIPVFSAAQLNVINKANKDPSEIIGIHRIGRAKNIADNACVCFQIETRNEERTRPDLRGHLIKNRDGELAAFSLQKNWKNAIIKDQFPPFNPNDFESSADISVAKKNLL